MSIFKTIFNPRVIVDIFTKNVPLKILSVIIATMLWVVIVSGRVAITDISVPIRLINAPKNYVAVSNLSNISVTVKGSTSLISNLSSNSIILNIDVSSYNVGESTRRVLPIDFQTPIGIEVIDVLPDSIKVTVDEIASKTVVVIPSFLGEPPVGYKVSSITTNPNTVTVTGVKSKVMSLSSISTAQINLSDTIISPKKEIAFVLPDGVKTVTPAKIEVTIKLSEVIERQDFEDVPVSCIELDSKFKVAKPVVIKRIRLTGRVDLLEKFITTSSFNIDCSDIRRKGVYFGRISIQSTVDGVTVNSITPERVRFEIEDA